MRRGTKPTTAEEKARRGTGPVACGTHPKDEVETDLPRMPAGFPAEAEEVWNDLIVHVERNRLATERDSQAFANLCQLQAIITAQFEKAFKGECDPPSIAGQAELRKQLEVFGLGGVKSRTGGTGEKASKNPFKNRGVGPA